MTDIIDYLNSKNIDFKIEGAELVITCPNCKKKKLYIHKDSGVYQCFRCIARDPDSIFAKGHISKLKEYWGDIVHVSSTKDVFKIDKNKKDRNFSILVDRCHDDLLKQDSALKYLFKRGISEESVNRFKLGYRIMENQSWLVIPSYENDIPMLVKYRKLEPDVLPEKDKYIREPDGKSILFNQDSLNEYDEIIITEGELDAITLLQNGYQNVVGVTVGAGSLSSEWYDKLSLCNKIYLVFDPDSAGQNSARDVWATRLGINRCWNVNLPDDTDVNDFFLSNNNEAFNELIKNAIQFKIDGIKSLSEALYEMYRISKNEEDTQVLPLPWDGVNKLIGGGLGKKRLTVLGGNPGMGKTSFSLQICYHFAKEYNIPSLFFCLEMSEIMLATKIIQLEYGLTLDQIDYSEAPTYAMFFKDLPLYFGYASGIKPDVFYNTMKEVRNRYGVGFGVFDNIQRMIRTGEEADMSRASSMFKDLVMDLNIPFMLISQPRKPKSDSRTRTPTYDDLKGSSAIPADADEILLIHRKRSLEESDELSFEPEAKIIVDKGRFSSGGKHTLFFDGSRSTFMNMEK